MIKSLLVAAVAAATGLGWAHAASLNEVNKIAFGSCSNPKFPQPLWPIIDSKSPDLWIWMGDNIYADFKDFNDLKSFKPPFTPFVNAPPSKIEAIYKSLILVPRKQLSQQEYKQFTERVPIIGTWDDHDYGRNDGGKWFPYKEASQQLFLKFIGEPEDSPRWKQKGIYSSYTYGSGNKQVKVILLDTRYHRDYYKNKAGDFLGKKQWEWLTQELSTSTAAVNIIVSSIQLVPTDKLFGESWNRFEKRRQQMLDLIAQTGVKGVVFLSGDVHYAEVSQAVCNGVKVTEITSSGMTHSWGTAWYSPFFWVADYVLPWPYRPRWDLHYAFLNFGELEIHWDTRDEETGVPEVTARLYGVKGETAFEYRFLPTTFPDDTTLSQDSCQPVRGEPHVFAKSLRLMVFSGICTLPAAILLIFSVWVVFSSFFFVRDKLFGTAAAPRRPSQKPKTE